MKMLKLTLIDEPRNYARMLNDGLVLCVIQNQVLDLVWDTIRMPVHNSIIMSVRSSTKESTNEIA